MSELLDFCLYPLSFDEFAQEFWEKKPLVNVNVRRNSNSLEVISLEEFDELISCGNARANFIRVIDGVSEASADSISSSWLSGDETDGVLADLNTVYAEFDKGRTIQLQHIELTVPFIGNYCRQLEQKIKCSVDADTSVTPANSTVLSPASDTYGKFVLQAGGTSHVKVLKDDDDNFSVLEAALNPNDVFYIPRGYSYIISTADTLSLSVRFSMKVISFIDLFSALAAKSLEASLRDVRYRKGLPTTSLLDAHTSSELDSKFSQLNAEFLQRFSFSRGIDILQKQFSDNDSVELCGKLSSLEQRLKIERLDKEF